MPQPWTIKHKPTSLKEVVGNREAVQKLVEWVRSWDKDVPKHRAAFIYGPPGIGKTVTVEALAKDFNMELIEKNASDYRTEEAVRRIAGLASQYRSLFSAKRIILFDELDGLTGSADKGGVKAMVEVIQNARCPIVLIANNAYDPRFSILRNYCLLIEFKKPTISEVMRHLKNICLKEGIHTDENALKFIAQRSEGDIRSAVTDLQAVAEGKKNITYEDVSWLGFRDRQEVIFNVLRMIFYSKTCSGAKHAASMAEVDPDMLLEWIYENIPSHFQDPHELARALDAVAKADVYRGRIKRTQDWSFTRYMLDLMTAGVAMSRVSSKPSGWVPFHFPTRISALSKSKEERVMQMEIGRKIRRKCHISAARAAKEVLPYLRIIFKNNAKMAAGIAKWLDLTPEMIYYIAEDEAKTEEIKRLIGI
ncbi:MAG: replication factor C large subunit [Nitrososphaerota archaeon]|nr:replication factor C large subunit [Candidatus Bathyarchaeota archaeon]MDW8194031.1 replication factor C large subunit [Nitrososphaerota archaeon]